MTTHSPPVRKYLETLSNVTLFICVLQFTGQLWGCVCAGRPPKATIKGGVQHLVQVSGGDKLQVGSDVGWKLLQVLLVAFGEDDALYSCPVRRQDFVLDPSHLRRTDQSGLFKTANCGNNGLLLCVCFEWDNSPAALGLLT